MHLESSLESEPVAAERTEPSGGTSDAQHIFSDRADKGRAGCDLCKDTGSCEKERESCDCAAKSAPAADDKWTGKQKTAEEYLLVDGYNIIFAWKN